MTTYKDDILQLMPQVEKRWYERAAEIGREPGDIHALFDAVFEALCEALVSGNDDTSRRTFIILEGIIADQSHEAREAVALNVLENLINYYSHGEIDASFTSFLGPASRAYCKEWDRFTEQLTPGLE